MEYIFIDTSVYEANNFTRGEKIRQLIRLSEQGHINILLPEIVYQEITNHIKNKILKAKTDYNKLRNNTRVFKILNSMRERLVEVDSDQLITEGLEAFNDLFYNANVIRLPFPILDTKNIFNNYFESNPPFGVGNKKREFPDAFAIATIELWCNLNNKTCKVYTLDKDFEKYQSDKTTIVKDYADDLSKKISELENLERLSAWYELAKNDITDSLYGWADSQVHDEDNYLDYTNWLEIHNIEIEYMTVQVDDYAISSVRDNAVIIEVFGFVSYCVSVKFDDENTSTWDFEDKVAIYQTIENNIEENFDTTLEIMIAIENVKDMFIDFEILKINNGDSLKIPDRF